MGMVYRFKEQATTRGLDPNVVGHELERLRARPDGLTPTTLVESARSTRSPLHGYFSWDLTAEEALQRALEHEASVLIRSIVVVATDDETGTTQTAPAFVSVVIAEERAYIPMVEALSDDQYRAQVLSEALSAFQALRRRYGQMKELARLFEVVDEVAAEHA